MLLKWTQGVNFINVFTYEFFVRTSYQQLFSSYMYVVLVKAAKTTFVQKNCTFNVDEIDGRWNFIMFIFVLKDKWIILCWYTSPEVHQSTFPRVMVCISALREILLRQNQIKEDIFINTDDAFDNFLSKKVRSQRFMLREIFFSVLIQEKTFDKVFHFKPYTIPSARDNSIVEYLFHSNST